jgi:predicted dehydrogenase
MPKHRCLMIGAGGMAGGWIRNFLPAFSDRMEIVGLVDVNTDALNDSGDFLGLPKSARFTDSDEAFKQIDADFCIIVTPPWIHRENVLAACEKGMHILSEKPIADTWESCVDIYNAVKKAGVKMEVIQNYRYNATQLTVREVIRSGRLGRPNYILGRFAADYRKFGSWGEFRHRIPHSLLVEGGVHHLDMLRNLSGSDCMTIAGSEWNPEWSSFDGESNALYFMDMENGVKAVYEGSCNAAGTQNSWHSEFYRAECEKGAVSIDSDLKVRVWEHTAGQGITMSEVPLESPRYAGHMWQVDEFLGWLDGGPEPDTTLDDNIKSVATMFAAITASAEKRTVDVGAMVSEVTG